MQKVLDFGVRVNPLGMPDAVRAALLRAFEDAPAEGGGFEALRGTIALRHGADAGQIALSDGEEKLFTMLAATASGARRALLPVPCPDAYGRALAAAGFQVKKFELSAQHRFRIPRGALAEALRGCDLLLMGNPSWPASSLMPPAELLAELDEWLERGGWLILDESAIDFTYGSVTNSLWSALRREPRTALIRSFTNSLALTLCPLCYAVGGSAWIAAVRRRQIAPETAPLAQYLAPALEHLTGFRALTVECVTHLMPRLVGRLNRVSGLRPLSRDANWILCRLERPDCSAAEFAAALKERGIIIHPCLDGSYFTLGLRIPIETDRFIKAAREILMPKRKGGTRPPV